MGIHHDMMLGGLLDAVEIVVVHPLAIVVFSTGDDVAHITALHGCITSFFAVHFVSQAGDGLLKILLGITLIIASLWFSLFAGKVHIKPNRFMQTILGTLSGIMGGLFGMQGPPAVLYFVETTETKEEYMAVAQTYFLIGNIMMTIYRAYYGFLTTTVLTDYCFGVLGVIAGTILGGYVFKRISLPILRKIIYAYMAISGIKCIFF